MQTYFQQILPLASCEAEDGRIVGQLLLDLVETNPKDLAHAIREFANRTDMLRACGISHMGDMLVAMLTSSTAVHSDSEHTPTAGLTAEQLDSATAEQAAAIGGMLAARFRFCPAQSTALHQALDSHSVLHAMKLRHVWFVPMLELLLEIEDTKAWIKDVEFDTKQREDRIAELESASGQVYDLREDALIAKGPSMFALFEASSAAAKQLQHSALVLYSETKLDEATGLLYGRAAAMVRATPQEIVAYLLNYDSRFMQSITDPAVWVRSETLEHFNAHHTIVFNRLKLGAGLSHRTFLNSTVAKRVADDPPTYEVVGLPIAQHDKIAPKDEKGAVRAENCRAFKLTELAEGITKLEYTCSLNLGGSIPQAITNKVSVPGQMHGTAPPSAVARLTTMFASRDDCARTD
jgi:hypothetical protein